MLKALLLSKQNVQSCTVRHGVLIALNSWHELPPSEFLFGEHGSDLDPAYVQDDSLMGLVSRGLLSKAFERAL